MSASDFLKQRFDRFEAPSDSISDCANQLRELGIRVCSLERLPANQGRPMILEGALLPQILNHITERNPGYCWDESSDGLINLFPKESVLDSAVPATIASSKGAWRLLEDDLNIGALGIIRYNDFGDPDGPPVNINRQHTDLRAALNAIVGQLKPLVWHIAGRPGAYYLNFTTVSRPR